MKPPKVDNWDGNPNLDSLLLFAQSMHEMLSYFTIDSYKSPIFTTHSICDELMDAYGEYLNGFLKRQSIEPIKIELIDNLEKDRIAQKILSYQYPILKKKISSENNIDIYIEDVKILFNLLHTKYANEIKNELIDTIINNPRKKKTIYDLTRLFVSELLYWGYLNEYLFYETESFFFSRNPINSPEQIRAFLDKFSFERKKYDVLFKAHKRFLLLKDIDLVKPFNIDVTFKLEPLYPENYLEREFFTLDKDFPLFIKINEINANDPYAAKKSAEARILLINNLNIFFNHSVALDIDPSILFEESLVYSDDKHVTKTQPIIDPIFRIPGFKADNINHRVNTTTEVFLSLDEESQYNLNYSLNSHYCANRSKTAENQLLSLWTAIETLLPPPNTKDSIIKNLVRSIEPLLGRRYIQKLIEDTVLSIKNSTDPGDINKIFSNLPAELDEFEKFSALLAISKYDSLLAELCKTVNRNPLLIQRIFQLTQKIQNSKTIYKLIRAHNRRLNWQLKRIYRSRNLITHKGKRTAYIPQLLENTHCYYDLVINLINDTQIQHNYSIDSIEGIMHLIKFEHESHLLMLDQSQSEEITLENFRKYLFGVT